MNKEVEVTGLQMQATTSDGLEISLGAIGPQTQATKTVTVYAPTADDTSWRRAIIVGEYYSTVGKLMPASSDDALDIFTIDAADVYAGGHAVTAGADITAAQAKDSALLTKQTVYTPGGAISTSTENDDSGYYIDVPMWIRASNRSDKPIYATVTVSDPDSTNGSDLVKAVRVAIIPVASSTSDSSSCNVGFHSSEYGASSTDAITVTPLNATPNASSTTKIFGLKARGSSAAMDTNIAVDWPTYHGKVISATGDYDTSSTLNTTSLVAARGLNETSIAPTAVFTMPAATADSYACVGFVARIWLEGESIYCEDATANQDWNIEFHFSTDNTTLDDYTPAPSEGDKQTYTITVDDGTSTTAHIYERTYTSGAWGAWGVKSGSTALPAGTYYTAHDETYTLSATWTGGGSITVYTTNPPAA